MGDADRLSQYGPAVFAVGLLVFVFGLYSLLAASPANDLVKTSLTERDIAIGEAKARGEKAYQFETSFIPGIGPAPEEIPTN